MSNHPCCRYEDFLKAMANDTRQRILALLQEREMDVCEIGNFFLVKQPTISHHLAVLKQANLVTFHREGKHVYYRSNQACVAECCEEILTRLKIMT